MKEIMASENRSPSEYKAAQIAYLLHISTLFVGIGGLIAVVVAYVFRSEAPPWLQSHFQFQIRTFWIGLLYVAMGSLLYLFVIGWFVLLFWCVWLIVRSIKGLRYLAKMEAYPDPESWGL